MALSNWLDSGAALFKDYGKTLTEAAGSGLKNTAGTVVAAAADVLKNAGTDAILKSTTSASKGTIKQPPKGTNADGSTVIAMPDGQTINENGKLVSTTTGLSAEKMMLYGMGAVGLVVLGVIVVKVIK